MIIYKINCNDNTMGTITRITDKNGRKKILTAGEYYTNEAMLMNFEESNINLLIEVGILTKINVQEIVR